MSTRTASRNRSASRSRTASRSRSGHVNRGPSGHVRGESHPRAVLEDSDVELLRQLHEQHGIGYKTLARKFEIPRETARDLARYRRR